MKSKNITALTEFFLRWKGQPSVLSNAAVMSFNARIIFKTDRLRKIYTTEVRINRCSGISDGNIYVTEAGDLTAEHLHTEFYSDYQDYRFKPDTGSLIVKGRSPKIGEYRVTIKPRP